MEFMAISIGVLALVCALVILFGASGARRVLAWAVGLFSIVLSGAALKSWLDVPREPSLATAIAEPVEVLPPLPSGFKLDSRPGKIAVSGPDGRTFVFNAPADRSAIERYMHTQFGAPGSAKSACWAKEPGPWCGYRQ